MDDFGFQNNIVYIHGNLTIDTDKFSGMGIYTIVNASELYAKYADKVILGDLTIDDSNVIDYSAFTSFITKGDIIQTKNGDCPDATNARKMEFLEMVNNVDENTPLLFFQLLYVYVFSFYEASIANNLIHISKFKDVEIASFLKKRNKFNELIKSEMPDGIKELKIYEYMRSHFNTMDKKFTKALFFDVFNEDVSIPEKMSKGYSIRNSIVHRSGCHPDGQVIYVNKADILDIYNEVCVFLNRLNDIFNRTITNQISHSNTLGSKKQKI